MHSISLSFITVRSKMVQKRYSEQRQNLIECTYMGEQTTHCLSGNPRHVLIWELCVSDSRERRNHVYWMLKCVIRCTWYFKGIWDQELMLLHRKPGKNSQMIKVDIGLLKTFKLQGNQVMGAAIGQFVLLVPCNPFLSTSGILPSAERWWSRVRQQNAS